MNSEKFNELADAIAERAAKKIQTGGKGNKNSLRNEPHSDATNKKKHMEIQTDVRNTKVGDKKKNEESPEQYGKINTEAFLQNDASSKELYLNYKHITKELERNKNKNKTKPKKVKNDRNSDRDSERIKPSKYKNKEKITYDNNVRKDMNMKKQKEESNKNRMASKYKVLNKYPNVRKNKTEHKIYKSSQEFSEDVTREINNRKVKKHPTTQIIIDNEDISSDLSHSESKHKNESQDKNIQNYYSKEVVEVEISHATSDKGSNEQQAWERVDILTESKENHGNNDSEEIVSREI